MLDPKRQAYNEWLVIRSQQGERDAFEELLGYWRQRYLLYAIRRLDDRDAARDVTQDCLVSISRSLNKLADPAAYPKWSFRILERRCIDWQRRRIKDREVIQHQEELPEVGVTDRTEDRLSVEEILAQLDPRLSALLRLYYLESMRVSEIAQIYNVPSGTIKSRLFYARKMLASALDKAESNN